MATKPDKEKTSKKAGIPKATGIKKTAGKPKKAVEEDDDLNLEEDEAGPKTGKKSMSGKNKTGDDFESDDDLNFEEEEGPNMKKGETDENWDPDFDEFDLPKSSKKSTFKKSSKENEDDYKIDDEFKDLFGSRSSSSRKYNEDDDY